MEGAGSSDHEIVRCAAPLESWHTMIEPPGSASILSCQRTTLTMHGRIVRRPSALPATHCTMQSLYK
jgi:hypothetical protein